MICPIHHRPLFCPACVGAKGGGVTSRKKRAAARKNGRLGGRPKKIPPAV